MKKKILAFILCFVTAAAVLTGCGRNSGNGEGSVYYLNFKPEQDAAWKKLAKLYGEETGVKVTVVTAASGEYETTLMSEMGKSSAPTLFQVNGPVGLNNWKDYCYDLSDTKVYKELSDDSYALKNGNRVDAIAYVIESYGLITNKTLLEKAGHSVDEIKSFDDLKRVAESITERSDELGFAAFASSGMDSSSDWRFVSHLAGVAVYYEYLDNNISYSEAIQGKYLDNFRAVWDLYINNSTCRPGEITAKTVDDARNEFLAGKAVFYQNGSWEYSALTGNNGFSEDELVMLPMYIGAPGEENQGLCTGTENYWCVNKDADEADIHATLDFMYWCVTSETGTRVMAEEMGFVIPFKNKVASENIFVKQNDEYIAEGRTPVTWAFTTMPSLAWKNTFGSALTAYAANPGDKTWQAVERAFIDNWEKEYNLANE